MIISPFGDVVVKPGKEEMEERIYRKLRPLLDAMPGSISLKHYVADDDEELGVIRFDSRESLDKWMHESAHADVQKLGPEVYERHWIQTAESIESTSGRTGSERTAISGICSLNSDVARTSTPPLRTLTSGHGGLASPRGAANKTS